MFSCKFCTVRSFKHSYLYNVKKYFHSLYFQAFMSLFQNIIHFTFSIEISIYHNKNLYFLQDAKIILIYFYNPYAIMHSVYTKRIASLT
ncbi:hypothetical protein CKL83_23560 [Bacillus anthracis]|nr:hypothetical protein BZG08_09845 [Bacillus anthracis]OON47794.1 hypothetical protein B0R37_14885 [Bacillus anthracis]OOX84194.1 hypothetical protein BEU30_08930 [Bacillus anthracis]OPE66351.1 hypothetical protein BEU28_21390 [Bacillus anthracis]OPE68464.1 hypothetical protein BEU29_10205 [Bacillus anthracis]